MFKVHKLKAKDNKGTSKFKVNLLFIEFVIWNIFFEIIQKNKIEKNYFLFNPLFCLNDALTSIN
jgi:hypothetical protein